MRRSKCQNTRNSFLKRVWFLILARRGISIVVRDCSFFMREGGGGGGLVGFGKHHLKIA